MIEFAQNVVEETAAVEGAEASYILEQEKPWLQLADHADKIADQRVAGVGWVL
jgi:hypothetical protein